MKRYLAVPIIAVVTLMTNSLINAPGAVAVSVGLQINSVVDFHEPLAPMGAWVDISPYGQCWHPVRVEADWRPYCNGHWEWTDAGWYWVSEEPWSWACYHYGSWIETADYGWCWVPGVDWSPAWVTWRVSDEFIGWAPCGPHFAILPPPLFVFIDTPHFRDHLRRSQVIVNNTTIINQTKVINNFSRQTLNIEGTPRTVFVNRGPDSNPIQQATRTQLTPRPLSEVTRETPIPKNLPRTGREQARIFQLPPSRSAEPPPNVSTESRGPIVSPEPRQPRELPPAGEQPPPQINRELPQPPADTHPVTPPPPTGRRSVMPPQPPTVSPEERRILLPPKAQPMPRAQAPRGNPPPERTHKKDEPQ